MFRPARFWPPRAKIRTSARARQTFFGDPPTKISKGFEIKFDINKNSILNWYFNSIKGAESSIPPQDGTRDRSQPAPREAQVAGLKSSQSTLNGLNLTQARLESGLGWTFIKRKYEYEIKMRAIQVQ
ncbi:hypothetical protein B0H11DRAFT_1905891 [Mycena galericulata]|nr:hypothetical protein B0H11DRAFT_1905891 [Mycena galericulata]